MPVILLNRERVATEIVELARLKISKILRIPMESIKARWEHEQGKPPCPAFDIDASKTTSNEDEIRQSVGAIWRWVKDSLRDRLAGLENKRV